jgi:hypothetical protein
VAGPTAQAATFLNHVVQNGANGYSAGAAIAAAHVVALDHVVPKCSKGLIPEGVPWSPQDWERDSDQGWHQDSMA